MKVIVAPDKFKGSLTAHAAAQAIAEGVRLAFPDAEIVIEMEGSELELREEALGAVARRAMERKTGARGLRTILEQMLLDTMYDLPSMQNVHKVVIDESVVTGHNKPYFIYENVERRAVGHDT